MPAHIEQTKEFELSTPDRVALFVRDWPLPDAVQGQAQGVLIMHGLGEHCGRYAHVARFFNALGFAVRTYDHRGHGKSGGAAGDVPDDDSILHDARLVMNDFGKQLAGPPLLFGHSMGGLFAARFALEEQAPLRGLILSSPALAIRMSGFQQVLLKLASALIPGVGIPNGLETRYLTHDGEVIQAYENDALVHPRISARLLRSMLRSMDYVHDNAPSLKIPVLLLAAADDRIVDLTGSERFLARLPPDIVTAYFYEGYYHEIFNELDATRVFDDLRAWLEQQGYTPLATQAQAPEPALSASWAGI
ncbi:MAG: lysophospholipase [Burkholderiales bacterium]|nr:lysophospholipase [Burkholderiales bacterium]